MAIDRFMTELSRVIRNWPAARVNSTIPPPTLEAALVEALVVSSPSPDPWALDAGHHLSRII